MANPIYPGAIRDILHPEAEDRPAIVPTATSLHRNGYNGTPHDIGRYWDRDDVPTDSHFNVDRNGDVYQYMPINRKANAQAKGNSHCVSIETWDGGDTDSPMTEAQVAALIKLYAWLNKEWGVSLAVSTTWNGPGAGWHSKYPEWNPNGHACPGAARVKQLVERVLPAAKAPKTVLKVVVVQAGSPEHRLLSDYPALFGDRDLWVTNGKSFEVAPGVDAIGFGVRVSRGRSYVGATRYETLRLALDGEK